MIDIFHSLSKNAQQLNNHHTNFSWMNIQLKTKAKTEKKKKLNGRTNKNLIPKNIPAHRL